jgi:hypothetical protein
LIEKMKNFRDLSRLSRLTRIRKLAKAALQAYGLDYAELNFLQYFQNIIYRVDIPRIGEFKHDASPYYPNRYLLRIHSIGEGCG